MSKLAIATVTYRIYLRVENDDANLDDLHRLLGQVYVQAIDHSIDDPINKAVWEWHGDKIDKTFLDEYAWGDNSEWLTVRQVAEQHRNLNYNPEKDNP